MKQNAAIALKTFHWYGLDEAGKKVSGQLLAITEEEARESLNKERIILRKLKTKPVSLWAQLTQRAKAKDITLLTRQLATMLSTGVPLLQSLKLIANNQKKAELKSTLTQLIKQIEAGMPVSEALKFTSHQFDSFYIELIAAGEQSGDLGQSFARLANYREKNAILQAKVKKALIYPSIVLISSLLITLLMLIFVIPQFETMFKSFGADLPWMTQYILTLSHFLQNHYQLMLVCLGLLILGFFQGRKKSQSLTLKLNRLCLKLPIIGNILTKASIAKFARTFATSFRAGIPILTCLQTTAKTAGSLYFEKAIKDVCLHTASGLPIYLAMRRNPVFPDMVTQMVMIGEESGKLDEMLDKIATIYEFDVDDTVDNLGKLIEPLLILTLGAIVGSLILSMYLPIFNLMSVIH